MKFYVDTNTFPTNPALYADAEKSKRIPQILPVVQLTRGAVQIGFLGENTPPDGALVEFSATIAGTNTQVVLARGEKTANGDAWEFNLNFNSEALSIALESKHADVMLIAGIIVSTEAFRQEWQLRLFASETATGELDPNQVESAKDFADIAERSATRAEEAARNSGQSAQGASESAKAAQASAEAAKKSQESAAQSAKEAAQSKADAVSAKNAAEKAKADAESAKTEAQKAASDAQATLGNVYTKSEIDGVSTGAEVVVKMNEIIAQLKDYEEVTGEKLPFDFWEAVMAEFQRWQMNPNEVKGWVTTKNADGTFTSTNPYYDAPPTKSVVNFNVKTATGVSDNKGSFSVVGDTIIYLPEAAECRQICFSSRGRFVLIAPSATSIRQGCSRTSGVKTVFTPKTKNLDSLLLSSQANPVVYAPNAEVLAYFARFAVNYNRPPNFPAATNWTDFAFGASKYNAFADMPSATTARGAFANTAMSAENISATLDSLPAWEDGASHVITFTGSPGAAELTQESPSVAAAIAKGWTVEL